LWRNRPRGTVLLFFDVKPVAVKAYGGRRYSKKRLVLSAGQKTHGLYYLFVAYEYNSGRRLWGFYPGKSSRYLSFRVRFSGLSGIRCQARIDIFREVYQLKNMLE